MKIITGWTDLLGTNSAEETHALTIDNEGNVYLAGYTYGDLDGQTNNGVMDGFITKYNADGVRQWTQLLGSSGFERVNALATYTEQDTDNKYIYVSGNTSGNLHNQTNNGGSNDAFLSKYNLTTGSRVWTTLLGTSGFDGAYAADIGQDGDIYLTGRTDGDLNDQTNSGGSDIFIVKYNPNKTLAWTRVIGTAAGDYGYSIVTTVEDDQEYIYVAGRTDGDLDDTNGDSDRQTNNGDSDAFITKYKSDGSRIWTKLLGSRKFDIVYGITQSQEGNQKYIYVTGRTDGHLNGEANNGGADAFITKYTFGGDVVWTKLLGGAGNEIGYAVTTTTEDGNRYIYISGSTDGDLGEETNAGSNDAFLAKYEANGNVVWTKLLATSGFDEAVALATGDSGSVYIGGYTQGNLHNQNNRGNGDAFINKAIVDNLFFPVFDIEVENVSKNEGDTGATTEFTFTVTRSVNTTSRNMVSWAVTGSSPNPANANDFVGGTLPSGMLTFAPGETSQDITVSVSGDNSLESNETFSVSLSESGNGATIDTATATGTIKNDDVQTQEITSQENLSTFLEVPLDIPLFYNTSTGDNTLTGLALKLHYNSADITYNQDASTIFTTDLFGVVGDAEDSKNLDGDDNTDRYIQFRYLNLQANWPNRELPLKLGDFNFTPSPDFTGTQLNITADSLAPNYTLFANPITVTKSRWNLDIDGDGTITPLSDGIIAMRYMYGDVFPGEELIAGAISINATRDLTAIKNHLQEGFERGYLDIDGDGRIQPLSDGITTVRYLFRDAFAGEALIEGTISPDATRDLGQIQSFLEVLTTIS